MEGPKRRLVHPENQKALGHKGQGSWGQPETTGLLRGPTKRWAQPHPRAQWSRPWSSLSSINRAQPALCAGGMTKVGAGGATGRASLALPALPNAKGDWPKITH